MGSDMSRSEQFSACVSDLLFTVIHLSWLNLARQRPHPSLEVDKRFADANGPLDHDRWAIRVESEIGSTIERLPAAVMRATEE